MSTPASDRPGDPRATWRVAVALLGLASGMTTLLASTTAQAHQGHSMQEPWHACEGAALSDACQWTDAKDALYVGTCRQVSDQLLCVRNQPIQHAGGHDHDHDHDHGDHDDAHGHDHPETPDHGHSHDHDHDHGEAVVPTHGDAPHGPDAEASAMHMWRGVGIGAAGCLAMGLLGLWTRRRSRQQVAAPLVLLAPFLVLDSAGCRPATPSADDNTVAADNDPAKPSAAPGLDPAAFVSGVIPAGAKTVECTLSNGETSSCYRIELRTAPTDHKAGPFCPRTIDDGPDLVGTWMHDGKLLDADGSFIVGLAEMFDDPKWKLYDADTGKVRYTETKEACAAAARPDVEEAYQNHCVECSVDYLDSDLEPETLLIPAQPQARAEAGRLGRGSVGVALNGVRFEAPAPVAAILGAYTIAAFDDCGGHVNLHAGYHYHGTTGCSASRAQADGHAALVGYATDGYPMHAMLDGEGNEANDLDACRGHDDDARGYHYHVASPGENMFIGCLHGETVATDGGKGGGPPGGRPPGGQGADKAGDKAQPGAEAKKCAGPDATRCCGDGTCDGPETPANCAADCSK